MTKPVNEQVILVTGPTDGIGRGAANELARMGAIVLLHGRGPTGRRVRKEASNGHELRFQINYLAPFLLQQLLLQPLRRAAPARIVSVASVGQAPIDFDERIGNSKDAPDG